MKRSLNIVLAQLNPIVGNIRHNCKLVLDTLRSVSPVSDLVIFPELFLSGYHPEDLVANKSFLDEIDESLEMLIKESKNFKFAFLIPCPWKSEGRIYNAAHLIEGGKILHTVAKFNLPNYGVFDEPRVFSPGQYPKPVIFRGVSLGFMICEDMWFGETAKHLKSKGADILIVPNGSPYEISKYERRLTQARARINETGLPLLYLNQVGGQDDIVYDGHSFAMNSKGELIVEMPDFKESLLSIAYPFDLPSIAPAKHSREESIYNALLTGLRDYVRKNGFSGILLGLSGGIDSALSAAIAADALGPDNVHCIMMPSRFTSLDSTEDAAALAGALGVRLDTIPIEAPVQSFHKQLEPFLAEAPDTTFENIQPRARAIILMALSNASGKLVLSTGNKSEMAVGYATLYGDMCGGFNVLKDVYKTEVYRLARWRNSQTDIIPKRILTRAPTAELKENQTDQDLLPPYEELDDILYGLLEQDLGIEAVIRKGHNAETVKRVSTMLTKAEYKRKQSPPGVKISVRAFGRDRRYPITNGFVN